MNIESPIAFGTYAWLRLIAILPKTVRRTLTKVAPRPPEADVAQIEAELLGLRATSDTSGSGELMPEMLSDAAILNDGPRLDLARLDTDGYSSSVIRVLALIL